MNEIIDYDFIINSMKELINTPSPSSYYVKIIPIMKKIADIIGVNIEIDKKHTVYITVDGIENDRAVCIGAHLDTIGLCVKSINANGSIKVVRLGGVNFSSLEGETVVIHTRDNKSYTGTLICVSHSVHVFDDVRSLQRDEKTMLVMLDEKVKTKKDVENLGILCGDVISIEPRFQYTDSKFIKSRFIDDKAAVAISLGVIKALIDNDIKPKYKSIFSFPQYEEVGHGGSFIPTEVEEYVALDIGLTGPDLDGSEFKVSICAKDGFSPYDRALTSKIINIAKKRKLDFAVDVFTRYGTDANAAITSGGNISTAAFGMGTMSSHGMERTHMDAIVNTANLLMGYLVD